MINKIQNILLNNNKYEGQLYALKHWKKWGIIK